MIPPFILAPEDLENDRARFVASDLQGLGQYLREQIEVQVLEEHADWVLQHRAPQATSTSKKIEKAKGQILELEAQLGPYDRMLSLLDGTGEPLVDTVVLLFDKPDEGISVTKTEKGSPLDLFMSDAKGRCLAVEVTGVKGALKKDDPHWADFLEYLPEHAANNLEERKERIVLVVNTQRDTPLDNRNRRSDITSPVRRLAEDNHLCVIRSVDLYDLWLRTLEGLAIQEAFNILFNTNGIYEPQFGE